MIRKTLCCCRLLALASIVVLGVDLLVAAPAAPSAPSFKRRGESEKRFAAEVGEAIVKAAHKTAKTISLVEHKYTNPKPNRTELRLKLEYTGVVSGKVSSKKYLAEAVVKIDSTDKDSWEVLSIDYSDNNNVPESRRKLDELVKQMNK